MVVPVGRFAPSPTGRLHVGNLRTGLVAWLAARSTGSTFLIRFEDLDTGAVRSEHYDGQLTDLAALGLDWDEPVVRQSDRRERYVEALGRLQADDAVYPCFCSRREIREAAQAPTGRRPLVTANRRGTVGTATRGRAGSCRRSSGRSERRRGHRPCGSGPMGWSAASTIGSPGRSPSSSTIS